MTLEERVISILDGTKPTGKYINTEHILITRCDATQALLDLIETEKKESYDEGIKEAYEKAFFVSCSDCADRIKQLHKYKTKPFSTRTIAEAYLRANKANPDEL